MSFVIACLVIYAISALGVHYFLKDATGVTADEKSLFRFVTFCPILNTTILLGYFIVRGFYTVLYIVLK